MQEERQPGRQYNKIDLSEYQGPDMYIMEVFKEWLFFLPKNQPNDIEGLDGTLKIGGVLRDKSQYRELAVSYVAGSEQVKEPCNFEARLYDFNNLSPKQKRYKLRSMNRLRGRIVSSMHWDGYDFVIFRTGSLEEIESKAYAKPRPVLFVDSGSQTGTNTIHSVKRLC
ncbi:hypothetical protein GGR58DRAFT_480833 [Xylaria digitata]|nr:hypothetical protein GGR58DRAFT_480833 [Xylaria digitata]